MTQTEIEAERQVRRAAERLNRPGAWLAEAPGGYRVMAGKDRRRRPLMVLGEEAFRGLVEAPGLTPLPGGGWRLAGPLAARPEGPPPGRPGFVEGERLVADADGNFTPRRANLGGGALAWLAGRKDGAGRPWLAPRERAAAERLALDQERCGLIGRLTMSWDAGPRGGGPRGRGAEPAERGRAAKARLAAALAHLEPRQRAVAEHAVLRREPLEAIERNLGLRRRSAKTLLKAALAALADHYRIG